MAAIMAIYILGGILLILLSIPLILRKIPPNPIYGFRVQWTLKDPDLWYPMNAYTGKWLVFVGVCSVLGAVGLSFVPGISLAVYAFSCLGIFAASIILAILQSIRYLRKMEDQE
jgi:uncharacterized membrane protein